ncbi:MAG: bifunctional phosphoglucose/phosphomannose isomerase [Flavobacteriales bacterium]
MIQFISKFTTQLQEAYEIGSNSDLKTTNKKITSVIICGLGGSGIGGKIVSQIAEQYANVPFVTHNTYSLPNFVDENTLVIISSYSGNTEETVSAFKEALKRNSEIACVTSGGEIQKIANENSINCTVIPGGNPPRAMLTYSLTQLFFILNNYGIINGDFKTDLTSSISLLDNEVEEIKAEAKKVTEIIKNKTILIYTDVSFEGVGTRFKQQLNENSKTLAYSNIIPEMNHNELLGWSGGSDLFSVVFLRNDSDNKRNQIRMEISKDIISKKTNSVVEIFSKGESIIEKTFYHILLTDWISYYLSEEYGVDSIEIATIDFLKNELSKH